MSGAYCPRSTRADSIARPGARGEPRYHMRVTSPPSFAQAPAVSPRFGFARVALFLLASAPVFVQAQDARALSAEEEAQVQFQIMAGEMAAGRDQPGAAAQAFVEALKLRADPALAARATQLALIAGDATLAQDAARRWLDIEPTNMDPREVLARLALRGGDVETVYAQSLEIVRGHAGGPAEGFRHVALLLSAEPGQGAAVLGVLDRLGAQYPDLAGAHYARALAALRFDALDVAERSAREALRLEPKSNDYLLLLIGVLVRTDQLAEADSTAATLLRKAKKNEDRAEIRLTYARLLLDAGRRDHARAQLQAMLKDDPANRDARYALGVMAITDRQLDEARALFEPLAQDAERGGDAHYQLGRIAELQRDWPRALEHYRAVKAGNQAVDAAVRQAAVLARLNRVQEGRQLLEQLRRQFPPLGQRLILAEAEMLMDLGYNQDALTVYNRALEGQGDEEGLLYGRSLVFERMGRFPEAEADLRKILVTDPDNARALNALGYMLTVNTARLDEARRLIESALKQEPDDAAIIDSMGWVLFKLGEREQARGYLQKAFDKAGDPEISAHLGEVLWSLGEREKARQVWDQGLARDPEHPVLRQTIERLTR